MKVLSVVVHKLWPKLKFLSRDDDNDAGANDNSSPDFRHSELKSGNFKMKIYVTMKRRSNQWSLQPGALDRSATHW